jgi:hypothetical protein
MMRPVEEMDWEDVGALKAAQPEAAAYLRSVG